MLTTKLTYEYRRRVRVRARRIRKLKTSAKDTAKDNKVIRILITLVKIRDNRRAYTINIKVIS
jgi:hypothetical protein